MCGAVERGLFESLDVENCALTVGESRLKLIEILKKKYIIFVYF